MHVLELIEAAATAAAAAAAKDENLVVDVLSRVNH